MYKNPVFNSNIELEIVIDCNLSQKANTLVPTVVTALAIVTVNNSVHELNTSLPIVSSEAGRVIDVNPLFRNTKFPNVVSESGRVIVCKLVQSRNTLFPIVAIIEPVLNVTVVKLVNP